MGLRLDLCNDKAVWDSFVAKSPQETVFCMTSFLDALGAEYDLLLVEEDGVLELGAVVLKWDGMPIKAPFPLTMYQGVLFSDVSNGKPCHSRVKRQMDLLDFLIAEMAQRYKRISFCLHHAVEDLRSFQWFHYHEPQLGQFTIDLRYSGILDLSAIDDFDAYLSGVRELRRREYKRAMAEGLVIEPLTDMNEFKRLYDATFNRQSLNVKPETEKLYLSVTQAAISSGFGRLAVCRDKQGRTASASLFLYDNQSGYYLIGANDPAYRKSGSATYLMLHNIRYCAERGLKKVDFVGINSPNRGDYKTSFNAKPVPYFIVTWQDPVAKFPA